VLVLAFAAGDGLAAPKDAKAKAAFDQGIAAYQKNDYAKAGEAFGRSYGIEPDIETLFAWAQAERQANHCDKAIELYTKLLKEKLPDENKQVVNEKLGECRKILGVAEPAPEPPKPEPAPVPPPKPQPVKGPEGKSRWKDPIGGALVGAGVVGLGVGGYFLMSGSKANSDAKEATTHADALELSDKAKSQGRLGVIMTAVGGGLLVGGIVRYVTNGKKERTQISGWIDGGGGGVAALGRF
jgi:tetratricopeptide (TPR) repeat protein